MLTHEFLNEEGNHIPYMATNWYAERLDEFYDEDKDNNGYVHGIYSLDEDGSVFEVEWFKDEKERDKELKRLLKEK